MDAAWIFTSSQYLLGALLHTSIYLLLWPLSFLHWLASPFLYALRGLLALALLPLQLFIRFEAFLYFMTGAVLTGIVVGLILHFTNGAISQLLRSRPFNYMSYSEDVIDSKEYDWDLKWEAQLPSTTILEEEETSQGSI